MDNKEDVLNALEDFCKNPSEKIPEILETYLKHIAKTGVTVFPWGKLKPLFEQRLNQAISEFHERFPMNKPGITSSNVETLSFDIMRDRILDAVKTFSGCADATVVLALDSYDFYSAPFTIQRLCELITTPGKHYRSTDKYLRGIEKNIMVVSTVDPLGRKIVNESAPMVNGIEGTPTKPSFPIRMESPANNSPFVPPAPSNSPVVNTAWVTENGSSYGNVKPEVVTTLWETPVTSKGEKKEAEPEEEEEEAACARPAESSVSTSTAPASTDVAAADDIESRRSSGGFETSSYSTDTAEPSPKKPRLDIEETTSTTTTTVTAEEEKEETIETSKEEEKEEVVEEKEKESEIPSSSVEPKSDSDDKMTVDSNTELLCSEKSMETTE